MNLHISSLLNFLIISFSVVNLNANKKYWWLSPWCHCIFLYKKFDVFYEFQVSLIIFYHFGCIKKKQFNNRMYVYYIYTNLCHTVVDMIVSFIYIMVLLFWSVFDFSHQTCKNSCMYIFIVFVVLYSFNLLSHTSCTLSLIALMWGIINL